ncbi:hypothetical protein PROFUN_07623 [Planoprotostelium fungivorum]|uniref:40S ribosomal protein S24 n=1 Tax=Planoprotostelium fungivorum TaxID=1890364 RepID=A0A2P6NK55_9EUKA|nr:hypothetical protein PROFUN_07623 [Planoprotostelium fungivorum]
MSDNKSVSLRTRKFITNRLLARKQFVVEVIHPGLATVPKAEIKDRLAKLYKVSDPQTIVIYGFTTNFGGNRSSGFGLIYDNLAAFKKYEPKYRLVRAGLATKGTISRKLRKEKKNRVKKVSGTKKAKILYLEYSSILAPSQVMMLLIPKIVGEEETKSEEAGAVSTVELKLQMTSFVQVRDDEVGLFRIRPEGERDDEEECHQIHWSGIDRSYDSSVDGSAIDRRRAECAGGDVGVLLRNVNNGVADLHHRHDHRHGEVGKLHVTTSYPPWAASEEWAKEFQVAEMLTLRSFARDADVTMKSLLDSRRALYQNQNGSFIA